MRRNVGIHAQTHPYEVEGCYNCRLLSVSIAPAAMPTRRDVRYSQTTELEKNWNNDIPAYRRLVKDGIQPAHVDGAADMEAKATSREQIETETYEPIVRAK